MLGLKSNRDEEYVQDAARWILESPEIMAEVKARPYLLIEAVLTVVDKNKKTVPFFLNEVQKDFISQTEKYGKGKPYFILKGRQQGFTTLITAIQLCNAIVSRNFSGFTLANVDDNTKTIFNDKARMVYDRLPEILKPHEKFNSKKELFFDKLNSSWRIATATKDVGRSKTLNFIHYSEVAFFQVPLGDLQSSIGEAATADCFIVYETTANGYNEAKELWDSESCINLFYEWWRTAEYVSSDYSYLEKNKQDQWLQARLSLLQEKGLTKEQLAWYAKKYDAYIDKEKIKQEYPISAQEAFLSSGECIFDKDKVANQYERVKDLNPLKTGYFKYKKEHKPILNFSGEEVGEEIFIKDIQWVEDVNGYIRIHEEPVVKTKEDVVTHQAPYAIGGDTSGLGIDYYTAKVVNIITRKTAATLHKQSMDDDLYAEQLYCLGKTYHDAVIGIEVNYSYQPTKYLANKLNYRNLYMRERVDTISRQIVKSFGFETTSKTRPIILSDLQALVREDITIEEDATTLLEMLTFVKNDKGRAEAMIGYHDDLIMALAIAHYIANSCPTNWIEVKQAEDNFIARNFNLQNNAPTSFVDWD